MAAQLHSVCGGDVWLIMHDEFGQLGTLSQSRDADGMYVLILRPPVRWYGRSVEERGYEEHRFATRTEARDYLVNRFWSRFKTW